MVYREPRYQKLLEELPADKVAADRARLFYFQ